MGVEKNVVKNQSCSKLPEMVRQFINNYLAFLSPSPQKKIILKQKDIKVVPNYPKWRENKKIGWKLIFVFALHKKMALKIMFVKY